MKKIWIKNFNKLLILVFIILFLVAFEIVLAATFGYIIDSVSGVIKFNYAYIIIICIALVFTRSLAQWLYEMSRCHFIQSMLKDLKKYIFENYIKLDVEQFYSNDIGDKISLLTNDLKIVENDYLASIVKFIYSLLLFIFSFVSIVFVSYQMTIALGILTLISVLCGNIPIKSLKFYKEEYSDSQSNYTSRTNEYFSGYETIKSFGIESIVTKNFFGNVDDVYKKGLNFQKRSSLVNSISLFFGGFTFLGGFLIGGLLSYHGIITLGEMVICIQLTNHIVNPLTSLIENYAGFKSVDNILKKIEANFTDEKLDNTDSLKYKISKLDDKIEFDSVYFKYDDKIILKDINLSILKNKKYAIVGASGSGKSTLLKLISKVILPTKGTVLFDDKNLNEIGRESIIKIVSTINQNVFLFKGSIYDNITLYDSQYSVEEVEAVMIRASLSEYIKNIKDENSILENGTNFSGGEKQRISIARALIKGSDVILADEALSSLDNKTAFSVERGLLNLDNVTLVSVTHRLIEENLKLYDKIIVLKDGQIVEEGTFFELMNFESYFKKLFIISEIESLH